MSDLISRKAAMDEMSKQQTYKMFAGEDTLYLDANDVGSVLASLPSAQPEHGKWIPCSEKLPDKNGIYLCTVGADYRNPREMIYEPDDFYNEDSTDWMSIDGYRVFNWFVIAWMPLPEPYKTDEVEE